MKKVWFLKVLGISLFVFAALFFIAGQTLADTYIEFDNIDKNATEAQKIYWEIKAWQSYKVVLYMDDDSGDDFTIEFRTDDGDDSATATKYIAKIGDNYYDDSSPSTKTYTANLNVTGSSYEILPFLWALKYSTSPSYTNTTAKIKYIRISISIGTECDLFTIM